MNLILLDRDGTLIPNEIHKTTDTPINKNLIKLLKEHFKDSLCFIITNQAGVALGYYSDKIVNEINEYLITYLKNEGINAVDHNYCPYVDYNWALKTGNLVKVRYVQNCTKRKPSTQMVYEILDKHKLPIELFEDIIVFGDRHEDKEMAEALGAVYIEIDFDTPYEELEKKIK